MLSDEEAADRLEKGGFSRAVAGEADFALGVKILVRLAACAKGLILSGGVGCGKSTYLRAAFPNGQIFTMPSGEWVLQDTQNAADHAAETIVLDDIGSEHQAFVGCVKTEPFADFVMRRYQRFAAMDEAQRRRYRLVIATNYNQPPFAARYGARVVSRTAEMCLAATFGGNDKRKWEVVR